MKRSLYVVSTGAAVLALAACTVAAPPESTPAPTRAIGAETITPTEMYARIGFLADDALLGRDTPSQGLDVAAAYIVSEYRRMGLQPAGEGGTFYQRYPYPLRAIDTVAVHFGTMDAASKGQRLAYGTDFYAQPVSAKPGAALGKAGLVYVGKLDEKGLPAGDYKSSIPMVLVPGAMTRDWRTEVSRATRAAEAAGAPAVVLVLDASFPDSTFRQMAVRSQAAQRALLNEKEIPVFYLTNRAATGIVSRAGVDLARATGATPLAGLQAHFAAPATVLNDRRPPNVVAVLPGSDPALKDEYVILSGHMDHVGVGRPVNGDSIYNGADDDASGTAGLLAVAQAMASLPERPRRSIVFLHVSGEEKGLIGSRWYSDHPTIPLEKIVANVNVDMIGRNSPDSVVVIGKDYSSLGKVVNAVGARHPELKLVAADDIWPEERFFFRSDHFNFARKEVPSIFFFTGVHEDYHRPSDEVDKIDTDKAARIARLIFYTVKDIANADQRPVWDPKGLEEVRALTR